MQRLDGNALAGILVEALGADPTGTRMTCFSCGAENAIAQLLVTRHEDRDEGICPTCRTMVLVVTRFPSPVARRIDGGSLPVDA